MTILVILGLKIQKISDFMVLVLKDNKLLIFPLSEI